MNNNIHTFEHEQLGNIRCYIEEGKVYFLASDVAKGLGYRDATHMTRILDEDEKGLQKVETLGGLQKVSVISESGFYHAALKSRVENAKKFRRWVTGEVIPQIFRTGGYVPVKDEDDEKTILAKAVGILKRTLEQKEALIAAKDDIISIQQESIEVNRPKVQFADAVTHSEDSILIRDLAKLIASNGIEIGQTRLFRWMREHGYLFNNETRPIQKWVDKGLFVLDETVYDDGRRIRLNTTTRVTGKGQEYFVNGFVSGKFNVKDINSRRV